MAKTMNIPFTKVTIGKEEKQAVNRVLDSGWLAAGSEVKAFEREFSNYITPGEYDAEGNKYIKDPYYCIFTNSCTSALKMAYKWAIHDREDALIHPCMYYPENTFCATYSAYREMDFSAWAISYSDKAKANITDDDIVVNMHYGGVKDETPCLIEDSAHRIEPNDPLVGKIRCYSFYATKNMTTGSGGMFATNDKEIYERARLYWRDGLTTSTADRLGGVVDYEVATMAGGYDGNDIAAAIGRVQLKKLPEFTKRRNNLRNRYNKAFGQTWMGNHLYPYFVDQPESVTSLRQYLHDRGIGSGYHYPGTGWLGVSLPIYPKLTNKEQDYIIQTVKEWESEKERLLRGA